MDHTKENRNFIRPPLSSRMEINLVVNEKGQSIMLYEKPWENDLSWAEYDPLIQTLAFVCDDGKTVDLGYRIESSMARYLKKAENIVIAEVKNGAMINAQKLKILHVTT